MKPTKETLISLDMNRNYNYIHIPKTGGHSIKDLLGIEWIGSRWAHRTAETLLRTYGKDFWDKSLNITTVRNPYDRAISLWKSYHDTISFEQWIDEYANKGPVARAQYNWTHVDGINMMDLVLRFENMYQWNNIQHLGKSKRKNYQEYYNSKLKEKVYILYQKDFDYFDYDK